MVVVVRDETTMPELRPVRYEECASEGVTPPISGIERAVIARTADAACADDESDADRQRARCPDLVDAGRFRAARPLPGSAADPILRAIELGHVGIRRSCVAIAPRSVPRM